MSKYNSTQAEQIQKIATYLQQQRVKQGLTLEQIASMTFIRLPMLKALEAADIEQLPELIYVQGFIRRYGETLQLDGFALSHQITASEGEKTEISPNLVAPPVEESSMGQEVPETLIHQDNHKSVAVQSKPKTLSHPSEDTPEVPQTSWLQQFQLYWVYLLILGGAIAGLFYLFSRPPASEQTAQTQGTQTLTTTTKPVTQTPQTEETVPETEPVTQTLQTEETVPETEPVTQTLQTEETVPETEPVTPKPETIISSEGPSPILEPTTPSEVATNTANTTPETSPENSVITNNEETPNTAIKAALQLEGDSWLQVRVDGKVEYEGILKEGEQQNWDAQETLTIRAGNAGAVKLSVNNKPAQVLGELGQVKTVEVTPDS